MQTVYNIENIQTMLYPIFKKYNTNKAVLFGSYAKGIAKENSDIDIFVDSGLKGLRFFGLLEDVTNALNKDVDMIDISQIEKNSTIEKEIYSQGVLIYEK